MRVYRCPGNSMRQALVIGIEIRRLQLARLPWQQLREAYLGAQGVVQPLEERVWAWLVSPVLSNHGDWIR